MVFCQHVTGGVPCHAKKNPTNPAFRRSSKRRRGFPSETKVKRGHRSFTVIKNCSKSWDATICVLADLDAGFKKCCMPSGQFDGAGRNYFFPRIDTNTSGATDVALLFFWAKLIFRQPVQGSMKLRSRHVRRLASAGSSGKRRGRSGRSGKWRSAKRPTWW